MNAGDPRETRLIRDAQRTVDDAALRGADLDEMRHHIETASPAPGVWRRSALDRLDTLTALGGTPLAV